MKCCEVEIHNHLLFEQEECLYCEVERLKRFEWVSFDTEEPCDGEIVQQYLGLAVMEHNNPPDWAFPTSRWRGDKDVSATHWRYVDAPNLNGGTK